MTVSDESGQSAGSPDPRPKRVLRPLTAEQWQLARIKFETGDKSITHAKIAAAFNTSLSMVQKKSAEEQWSKGQAIVQSVRKEAEKALIQTATLGARKAGEEAGRQLAQELQPWIEAEKRSHIKRAIKRSKRALKRIDGLTDGYFVEHPKTGEPVEIKPGPKDEMLIATAEDKYDGIIRRNLGMNDSSALSGSLSVRVLTDGAAIELKQG